MSSVFSLKGRIDLDSAGFKKGAKEAARSAEGIGDELDDVADAASQQGERAASGFGDMFKKGIASAGIGAIVGDAIGTALERGNTRAQIEAEFGLINQDAARLAKIGGDLYADSWGESARTAGQAVAELSRTFEQNNLAIGAELDVMGERVLAVAQVWDKDFNEIIRSSSQLVLNGLAPDAATALDIIVDSFQKGGDKAGDMLETIDEYSQHWAAFGLSAQDGLGMMITGIQSGQRDTDKLADAVKEMRIRTVEDTDTISKAYTSLGLDADLYREKILAGGTSARDAYRTIIDALEDVEDPAERNRLAIELIGTQYEDLGPQALSILGSISDDLVDVEGKAADVATTVGDTNSEAFDRLQKKARAALADVADQFAIGLERIGENGASIDGVTGKVEDLKKELEDVRSIGEFQAVWEKYEGMLDGSVIPTQEKMIETLRDQGQQIIDTTATQEDMITVSAELADAGKEAVTTIRAEIEALDDKEQADRDAAKAAADHAEEMRNQEEAADDLRGGLIDLVGQELKVEDSASRAKKAEDDLNQAWADNGADSVEYKEKLNDAKQAHLDAAQAAVDYEIDLREANGEVVTAQDEAGLMATELGKLAASMAPGSPLRSALDEYIAEYDRLQSKDITITTRLKTLGSASGAPTGGTTSVSGRRAFGGPVQAGHLYWVNDENRKGELFQPAVDGYEHSRAESAAMIGTPTARTTTSGGLSPAGPAGAHVTVQVQIGERDLMDIIDTRIDEAARDGLAAR